MPQQPSLTLEEIAHRTASRLVGNPAHQIDHVAELDTAQESAISFLANPKYTSTMSRSQAGAIFIAPGIALIEGRNFLINENPSQAFQHLVEHFYAHRRIRSGFSGVHPTAVIHPEATLAANVTVGPNAVIDQGATIGEGTFIGAGTYVGPFSSVGTHCLLHPHVTIREYCTLGNRVIVQPGAVIGSCGFGYTTDASGHHSKLEQMGPVIIADDVEIGANTTVDRARFTATIIGKGSKIDNLVQIGHGVHIGEHNIIVAQSGISGSTKTGRNVVMAGQSALVGHIKVADGVVLAARAAASKSLEKPGEKYAGAPAEPLLEHHRNSVYLRNIEKHIKRIDALEKKLTTEEPTD